MEEEKVKNLRIFGYDILINTFERYLRNYTLKIIFANYGKDWQKHIPQGVINQVSENEGLSAKSEEKIIDDFFDELTFLNLKDIILSFDNFKNSKLFFGSLSKDKFGEIMDELNILRRKIAHCGAFSELELSTLKEHVYLLSQGSDAKEVRQYLNNEAYKNATEIPSDFLEEYDLPNNLPAESYDLDGGFVGREKEIRAIKSYIKSGEDRVITITGAGGVGKTAIALRVAYSFLCDSQTSFAAILWFSGKKNKLTEEGIVPIEPEITSYEKLLKDIIRVLNNQTLDNFLKAKVPFQSYADFLNDYFRNNKCLLIIDNLETILKDHTLIQFIEEIPRPSQVLITSRKGLGEFERRYAIGDMLEKDALSLFRIVAKEKNLSNLQKFDNESILKLVKRVRCYPLLIKWAIGQVGLGRGIGDAFSQIFSGESEIAKFAFDDIFKMLSPNAVTLLYSMIIYGDKPISKSILAHLAKLGDEQTEEAIKELTLASFVFPQIRLVEKEMLTEYSMLELTRGFVEDKLDEVESLRQVLSTRLYHLTEQIQEFEKSKNTYSESLFSLGVKSLEEQIAFNYVKAAKNYYAHDDVMNAEKNFNRAAETAPNFSYVFTEYSKFNYSRGHIADSLELAEKAVKSNSGSFHAWFNYAIILEHVYKYKEALNCLEHAIELNPSHSPIMAEMGRVYMQMGIYDKAEIELNEALKDEQLNKKDRVYALDSLAENYKRWSCLRNQDFDSQINLLNKALDAAGKAIEINPSKRKIQESFYNISVDKGVATVKKEGFFKGKNLLESCINPIQVGKQLLVPNNHTSSRVYYYLALFGNKEPSIPKDQIKKWIDLGLEKVENEKLKIQLTNFRENIEGKSRKRYRKIGRITKIGEKYNFGFIESPGERYMFLPSGFRTPLPKEHWQYLMGKEVSYELGRGRRGPIAVNVEILPSKN
jgi:LuxR family transcriptional regulator, glucitol operon activator